MSKVKYLTPDEQKLVRKAIVEDLMSRAKAAEVLDLPSAAVAQCARTNNWHPRRTRPNSDGITERYCPRCKTWKAIDLFYNARKGPGGKSYMCKACQNLVNAPMATTYQRARKLREAAEMAPYTALYLETLARTSDGLDTEDADIAEILGRHTTC